MPSLAQGAPSAWVQQPPEAACPVSGGVLRLPLNTTTFTSQQPCSQGRESRLRLCGRSEVTAAPPSLTVSVVLSRPLLCLFLEDGVQTPVRRRLGPASEALGPQGRPWCWWSLPSCVFLASGPSERQPGGRRVTRCRASTAAVAGVTGQSPSPGVARAALLPSVQLAQAAKHQRGRCHLRLCWGRLTLSSRRGAARCWALLAAPV